MKKLWVDSKKELFTIKSLLLISVIALLYVALPLYILNYRFLLATELGSYPILYKLNTLWFLFEGLTSVFSRFDAIMLVVTGILIGLNVVLLIKTARRVQRNRSSLKFVVGGGSLLGFISTGCASCGFSILSLFGLGTVFSFLPFNGKFLYVLSIIPLIFSTIYMLKKLSDSTSCNLPASKINNLSPIRQTH